jgi:hypothetical protein
MSPQWRLTLHADVEDKRNGEEKNGQGSRDRSRLPAAVGGNLMATARTMKNTRSAATIDAVNKTWLLRMEWGPDEFLQHKIARKVLGLR